MSMGDVPRTIWRRDDIVQALAAYVWTARACGGTVDMVAVGHLCLAFGIDINTVAQRVRTMTEAMANE
jgi:hypothetical protein